MPADHQRCGNSCRVWSEVRNLLHTSPPSDAKSAAECQSFSDTVTAFFEKKVLDIRDRIAAALGSTAPDPLMSHQQHTGATRNDITLVTQSEVEAILTSISGKSSPLDFVPTSLLKSASGLFSRIIARLTSFSFGQGNFPAKFKTAQFTPLLKKIDMDDADTANYRSIFNI